MACATIIAIILLAFALTRYSQQAVTSSSQLFDGNGVTDQYYDPGFGSLNPLYAWQIQSSADEGGQGVAINCNISAAPILVSGGWPFSYHFSLGEACQSLTYTDAPIAAFADGIAYGAVIVLVYAVTNRILRKRWFF